MHIALKRIYDDYAADDGFRILVDRLWPRGIRKDDAHVDLWLKEVAPTTGLRRWYGHDPEKWAEFRRRYLAELEQQPQCIEPIVEQAAQGKVTLLYGARDTRHSHARVLGEFIERQPRKV
jgi:uncharacterized protein YeaO (DUF488 family)